jgi:hypothetical protein
VAAKDAAIALALQSLNSGNSGPQETPGQAAYVRKKRAKVGEDRVIAADALRGKLRKSTESVT